SPNIGPNDAAARLNARVCGSKVKVKPPADEPSGAVDTSRPIKSAITSPIFETPVPVPAALVSRIINCRGDKPLSVAVWAKALLATAPNAQNAIAARTQTDRLIGAPICDDPSPVLQRPRQ